MLKIPNGGRQTSWLFTMRGLGFANGDTVKQIQVVSAGLERGTSGLQDRRPDNKVTPHRFRVSSDTWKAHSAPILLFSTEAFSVIDSSIAVSSEKSDLWLSL